jgi:lipopolysaccharide biosynthesis regulator YciM
MGAALVLLLVALGAMAAGVLIGRYYVPDDRQLRRTARHSRAYMRALSHLIARDHETVMAELRAVVEENVEDAEPYFALGALFRSRGEHERAIRVHQALAVRERDRRKLRHRAMYELGLDFRAAGMPRRATRAMEKVLVEEPAHEGALRALAGLYEEQARFNEAAGMWQRLGRRRGEDMSHREHHLLVAAAQAALGAGDLESARQLLKAAQKHEESAHFYAAAAELASARGNHRGAKERLRQALTADPGLAPHLLPGLIAAEQGLAAQERAGHKRRHDDDFDDEPERPPAAPAAIPAGSPAQGAASASEAPTGSTSAHSATSAGGSASGTSGGTRGADAGAGGWGPGGSASETSGGIAGGARAEPDGIASGTSGGIAGEAQASGIGDGSRASGGLAGSEARSAAAEGTARGAVHAATAARGAGELEVPAVRSALAAAPSQATVAGVLMVATPGVLTVASPGALVPREPEAPRRIDGVSLVPAEQPAASIAERVLAVLAEVEAQSGPRLELALIRAQLVPPVDTAAQAELAGALVARFPDALAARVAAARLAIARDDDQAIRGALDGLVSDGGALAWALRGRWQCAHCGHRPGPFSWRCAQCRRWSTLRMETGIEPPPVQPRERRAAPRTARPEGLLGVPPDESLPAATLDAGLSDAERANAGTRHSLLGRVGGWFSGVWRRDAS